MAGKLAKYGPVSMSFGTGKGSSSEYHENGSVVTSGNGKSGNARSGNIMEEYLSSFIDEEIIISYLGSDVERPKALHYLDKQFHENNSLLIFQDKSSLFNGFKKALTDSSVDVRIQCTKLIAKIIPNLGPGLDQYMNAVLNDIIMNIAHCTQLQRESVQTLHICMKHSSDVFQILRAIADYGIQHKDPKTRLQIIETFPTLLFPEFRNEDFFDIVKSLASNIEGRDADKHKVMKSISLVRKFVGKDRFDNYVEVLPEIYRSKYNDALIRMDTWAASRSTSGTEIEQFNGENSHSSYAVSNTDLRHPKLSTSSSMLSELSNNSFKSFQDFSKSTYFDSTAMKNSLGRGYGSVRSGYVPARSPDFISSVSPHYEFGFISKGIIERLSSNDNRTRLQAVEDLKMTLNNLRDVNPLKKNIIPLISLLQPTVEDNNYRVSCNALQAMGIIVQKVGPGIRSYIKLIVNAVTRRLGSKDAIRSECMKVLLDLMEMVGANNVLEFFWPKLEHRQAKMREETINVIIAALLKFPIHIHNIDVHRLSSRLAPVLMDPRPRVRQAALECVSVIAHFLGTGTKNIHILTSAVDNVELMYDDATGIMSAVQARLIRKQLPRLKENMLVEYAVIPPNTAPFASPQGADIQWVLAVTQQGSQSSLSQLNSSLNSSHASSYDDNDSPEKRSAPPRRYLSAGKQRKFPWSNNESDSDRHPSSAPVQTQRTNSNNESHPPLKARTTWGPESEKASPSSFSNSSPQALRSRTNRINEQGTSNGTSYLELHQRKVASEANKPSLTNVGTPVRPLKRIEDENSQNHSAPVAGRNMGNSNTGGYHPSFGTSDNSTSRHPRHNVSSQVDALSNSCPTTFFEDNNQVKKFNKSSRRLQNNSLTSEHGGTIGPDDIMKQPESPIRLKPKLARSAKRRESPNGSTYENGSPRAPDALLSVTAPVKLKDSASPRLDRIANNPTVDKVRPLIKQNRVHSLSDNRPAKTILDTSNPSTDLSGSGYTPSGLQPNSNNQTSPLQKAVIRNPSHQMKSSGNPYSSQKNSSLLNDSANDSNNNSFSRQHESKENKFPFELSDNFTYDVDILPTYNKNKKSQSENNTHDLLKGSKSMPHDAYILNHGEKEIITHPRLQQAATSPLHSDTPRTAPHRGSREEDKDNKSLDLIRHSAQKKRDRMQRSLSSGRELNAMGSYELDGSFNTSLSGSSSGRATAPEAVGTTADNSSYSPVTFKPNSYGSSPTQSTSRDSLEGFLVNGYQSNPNRRDNEATSSSVYSADTGYISIGADVRKSRKSSKADSDANPFMTKPSLARPGSGKSNGNALPSVGLSSTSQDPPPFKYNPMGGVSFHTNNPKSNVSVVGLGYGLRSPSSSDTSIATSLLSPAVTPTNSSTSITGSPSTSNLSYKQSSTSIMPNQGSRDKRRNQRNSSLGMASMQVPGAVYDQEDDLNVHGKAIRDRASISLFEAPDLSPTPSKEDIPPWSSQSNESVNHHPLDGITGKAVRQASSTSDIGQEDSLSKAEQFPLSASLRQRQLEKKEVEQFRRTRKGKMIRQQEISALSNTPVVADPDISVFVDNKSPLAQPTNKPRTMKSNLPPTKTPPQRVASLDRKGRTGSRESSVSRNTTELLPCQNPERALTDAISNLQSLGSEDWEEICHNIHTIRRLTQFHSDTLVPKLHDVFRLLSSNVHNLRSQVSRSSVVCLADMYSSMTKPAVDIDIDVIVRALLQEHNKTNAFIKEEIEKALHNIVKAATSVKTLNALLAVGSGHRSKDIRNTTARFVADVVIRMGPGKALSGIKDTTEKIIPAASMFITDSSQDARLHGRRILFELLEHHDFEKSVDKYLNEKKAKEVKDCAQGIKLRGPGSIGSAGSYKTNLGSGVRRSPPAKGLGRSGNSVHDRFPQVSSGSKRRATPSKSIYSEQDQEEIKTMRKKLSEGANLVARKDAVMELREKIITNRSIVEDNIVKIMDDYASLLTTSNSKLNSVGLENLIPIVEELKNQLREPIQNILPAVCKLLASKQHCDHALKVLNQFLVHVDHIHLLQQLANSAMYSPGRTKQICIEKLAEIVMTVSSRKPQAVERHVLPVLWSLLSEKHFLNLKRETTILTQALYAVMGDNLLQYAENYNAVSKIKQMINS